MKKSTGQVVLRILFLLYGLVMLWLLFGQRIDRSIFHLRLSGDGIPYREMMEKNINLIPFATVKLFLRLLQNSTDIALLRHAVINLVGNVVMFVPLGFFLPQIYGKKSNFLKYILFVAAIILLVEVLQLITLLGSCDIDDLILNLLGASFGYLINVLRKKK